jgi:small subunit ribosomal protein S25e
MDRSSRKSCSDLVLFDECINRDEFHFFWDFLHHFSECSHVEYHVVVPFLSHFPFGPFLLFSFRFSCTRGSKSLLGFTFFSSGSTMPPKVQKSKAQKLLAAQSAGKSKGKKKKWTKGKMREKRNHDVVFDMRTLAKVMKEVPKKMKLITVYTLVEQYKITATLARRAIHKMVAEGTVKPIALNSHLSIYTRVKSKIPEEKKEDKKGKQQKKQKKKKKKKKGDDDDDDE